MAFENAAVAFAVDVSGSTRGVILEAEKRFVVDVSTMLSRNARTAAKILPWDGFSRPIISLNEMDTLRAGSGTTPAVILQDQEHCAALKESTVWFLITDGMIASKDREQFSRLIAEHKMHGTTCVTVVCGSTTWANPAVYDISVGVSLFAVVPNCLFLFYDLRTDEVLILQSKGIFKSFLGGRPNPVIDESTTWSSFSRLNYDQFRDLIVPAPQQLSEDEIALQDGLVVKFADLWSDQLSQDRVSEILSNQDNITSLVMTSQTREEVPRLQQWLQKQEIKVDNPLHKPRQDTFGAAAMAFREVMDVLKSGGVPTREAQSYLQNAYRSNMSNFYRQFETRKNESRVRSSVIHSSSLRSTSRIESASSLTPTPIYDTPSISPSLSFSSNWRTVASNNAQPGRYAPPPRRPSIPMGAPSTYNPYGHGPYDPADVMGPEPDTSGLLYTPGFRMRTSGHKGTCCICGKSFALLAWLFQQPPEDVETPDFPPPQSLSHLNFPLAMGNFPEVDVVSPILCCDPCSWFCKQQRTSPCSEAIVTALPMVKFSENKKSYLDVLDHATSGRFARQNLPQVFMAILISTWDTLDELATESGKEHFGHRQLWSKHSFGAAVEWVCEDLLQSSVELMQLSPSFSLSPTQQFYMPLGQVLAEQFLKTGNVDSPIIRYPLEGFPVLIRVAKVANVGLGALEAATFRRLLYALVEAYVMTMATQPSDASELPDTQGNNGLHRILWKSTLEGKLDSSVSTTSPAAGKPATASPESKEEPVFSIQINTLREAGILDEGRYDTLRNVEEFCQLEEAPPGWVGLVLATFLHTLAAIVKPCQVLGDPWELFNRVVNHKEVGAITAHPEKVSENDTRSMVKKVISGAKKKE